jgi:HPt (histidine-containing phosphotransfer) domain-containing protein
MTTSEMVALVTALAAFINVGAILWDKIKKTKPEVKKLEAEGESEIVEAAHTNLEASEISTKQLMNRIEELKVAIDAEKELRRQDRLYFARRIRELDRELHDYRNWAAQLAKQVIAAGGKPEPFTLSLDTDKGLSTDNPEK